MHLAEHDGTHLIPTVEGQKQEEQKSKVILGYVVILLPAWAT